MTNEEIANQIVMQATSNEEARLLTLLFEILKELRTEHSKLKKK